MVALMLRLIFALARFVAVISTRGFRVSIEPGPKVGRLLGATLDPDGKETLSGVGGSASQHLQVLPARA